MFRLKLYKGIVLIFGCLLLTTSFTVDTIKIYHKDWIDFNKNGVIEWFKHFNEAMPMPPHFHAIIFSAIGRKIDAIGV